MVPAHGEPTEDGAALAAVNREAVERTADAVLSACAGGAGGTGGATTEAVLREVARVFSIEFDWAQYALVGSTVRSYLVYLRGLGKVEAAFEDGYLRWRRA